MEILGVIFLFVCILAFAIAYGALSWGFVMYKFWGWFLLPIFPALPQITFLQAIGLAMFMSVFHTVETQVIKKEYKDETAGSIAGIVAPWITLLLGMLIHAIIY